MLSSSFICDNLKKQDITRMRLNILNKFQGISSMWGSKNMFSKKVNPTQNRIQNKGGYLFMKFL